MTRTLLLTLCLLSSTTLSASTVWLTWTGPGGAGGLTGSFPTTLPGTVTATRSNAIDGGAVSGIPGPVATTITDLTPSFIAAYGPGNPGLPFIANTYNDTGDRYNVTFNLTGLAGGALPSGSIFAFVDYDITESIRNLTAFTTGGTQITTPWLTPIGGPNGYIDAAGFFDETGAMSVPAPTLTSALGVYQVVSDAANMDSGFYAFLTNTPITSITYEHYLSTTTRPGGGGGGIAIGVNAVPEPGTWASLFTGFAALLAHRKLRKNA